MYKYEYNFIVLTYNHKYKCTKKGMQPEGLFCIFFNFIIFYISKLIRNSEKME